jgi:hypothetical protein
MNEGTPVKFQDDDGVLAIQVANKSRLGSTQPCTICVCEQWGDEMHVVMSSHHWACAVQNP